MFGVSLKFTQKIGVCFNTIFNKLTFSQVNLFPSMYMYIARFRIHVIKIEFTFTEPNKETPNVSAALRKMARYFQNILCFIIRFRQGKFNLYKCICSYITNVILHPAFPPILKYNVPNLLK